MVTNIIKRIDRITIKESDRITYDYLGTTSTYRELKQHSDAWAYRITNLGVKNKAPIMIWGGQIFEMVACFLGRVKAGHAYISITNYSNAERLIMIQDVSKSPLVTAIDELPNIDLRGLQVLKPEEVENGKSSVNEGNFVKNDENYYITFTPGAAGKPRGIQTNHKNLLSFVNWKLSDCALPENPSFLTQAPYSFDLSVMSSYPALVSADKLAVLPYDITENLGQLFTTLSRMQLNVWVSTPSLVQMYLLDPTFNGDHHKELTRLLFCGGELTHKYTEALRRKFPNSKTFNAYGSTEATITITQVEVNDEILSKYDRLPTGKVKEDTEITIDESKGEKPGQGELIISGPSASKGYLHNPGKTVAAFPKIDDRASHRIGDAGFLDGDMFFYRGRIDFQTKFNGYRVELEKISSCPSKNDLVRHGVVAPKYDKEHKVKQLIARIELNDGVKDKYLEAEVTRLTREDLARNVMPYMIPQRFVYREDIPILQNGKVGIRAIIKEVNA